MSLPAILTAVSGAISAVGAIQAANAQAAASEYNAQVDERNRKIADQNRKLAMETSRIEAEDKRRENRRTLATMRAAYGASGLDLAGSPLDVLADSATEMELDAQRIEYEGRIRNREGGIEMIGHSESAVLHRMEAKSAKSAGMISAMGYLTGGAGTALSRVN